MTLKNLWVNNPILNELRDKDLLKENCGKCGYRYYCGGCRARAYGYFNDYLAPDPGRSRLHKQHQYRNFAKSGITNMYRANDRSNSVGNRLFHALPNATVRRMRRSPTAFIQIFGFG